MSGRTKKNHNTKQSQTQLSEHKEGCAPCSRCFNTLGVESRMRIFTFLRNNGSSTVSTIVAHIGLTQPTVSYHLREMKDVGLLDSRRKGKQIFYRVSDVCPSCDDLCFLSEAKFA